MLCTWHDGIARHMGVESAGAIRAVCSYPDPAAIEALFRGADFDPVTVQTVAVELLAEDADRFVTGLMASSPVSDRIAALPPETRAAIDTDILAGFGPCHDGKSLRFPHVAIVVTARKPA